MALSCCGERAPSVLVLKLPVAAQHLAAAIADPPPVGGQRGAAAHEVGHGHTAGAVAELRGGRAAGRQVLYVDGIRDGDGKPQKCKCKQRFDHADSPALSVWSTGGSRWRRLMPGVFFWMRHGF